jgi:mRNA deadenylase 3'-5' endonuclease subunit Ccr4
MAPDLSARLSNFSNVALIGVFQNIHARSLKVRVVTTHLHWDPAFSDIKLLQASLLIDWLESTNALIPTVIAGDLNSKPGEPVVDYLVRGKVCLSRTASSKSMDGTRLSPETQPVSENTGASSNNIPDLVDLMSVSEIESEEAKSQMNSFVTQRQGVKLASAYNCRDLPYTNKTPDFEGVIDHILYSSGTLSIRDVLCDVYLPSQSSHEGISSLTNEIAQPYQEAESQFPTPTAGSQITQYGLSSYLSRV